MSNKDLNIPLSGMSNLHPMHLKDTQYPLMLNGNIQNDLNEPVTLTNEHSNILCWDFLTTQKVIGTLFSPADGVTFVWIYDEADPTQHQIGYVKEYVFEDFKDYPIQNDCDECVGKNKEDIPLEKRNQTPTCEYVVIAKGECLNFNIDYPVRTGVIKKDSCGISIYFTDNYNAPRYLQIVYNGTSWVLNDNQRVIDHYTADCNGTETVFNSCEAASEANCTCCQPVYDEDPTAVDCERLRLFPVVRHICIEPEAIVTGGTLRAGTYQLAACYSNVNGERATRTFSTSNPVSIFDPQQTLTSELSYPTDFAIKFLLKDLDADKYSYVDLFVVGTLNTVSSVKKVATIDITKLSNGTLEYTLSSFEEGEDVTIDDILQVFPVYELAENVTTAGSVLFWSGLKGPRDLNLQQAVNKLSSTIRWITGEANEDFYANGIFAANYRTYLRDEVYPLGVVFERNNTLDTCAYPFIGRQINTAFIATEPLCEGPCSCVATWISDIPGFVSSPGNVLFRYEGYWNNYTDYYTRSVTIPYSIVLYEDIFYISLTGTSGTPNIGNTPDSSPSDWEAIGTPATLNKDCYLCVIDDSTVSNDDVLEYPGCDREPASNLRWKVYNTACNRGTICNPETQSIRCVEKVDTIICNSYQYSPKAPISTTASATSAVGSLSIDVADAQGIVPGMTVSGVGIHPDAVVNTVVGNTITLTAGGENIADVISGTPLLFTPVTDLCVDVCPTEDPCIPNDCYTNEEDRCTNCEDNYPTPVTDFDDPDCPRIPLSVDGCGITTPVQHVRSKSDAEAFKNSINPATGLPYGYYLLCGDSSLVTYPSDISDPYMILKSSEEKVVLPASTKSYKKYDFTSLYDFNQNHKFGDPTDDIIDSACPWAWANANIVPTKTWLFANYNQPNNIPINNVPEGSIQVIATPDGQCVTYDKNVGPLMYMLGEEVPDPADCFDSSCASTTCPCSSGDTHCCDSSVFMGPNSPDYWNSGGLNTTGTINNTLYQSYWFNFYPTNDTMVIKSKLFMKMPGYTFAPGDLRIDVYEGNPFGTAKWSTGDSNATYYYDGSGTQVVDGGVLIIGDVANSTGGTFTSGQLPLVSTTQYFVHVYVLVGSPAYVALTTTAPVANCFNTTNPAVFDCEGNQSLCWYQNYGWADICVNSPNTSTTVEVTLPEVRQLECTYEIHYREYETQDTGCEFQAFEYGDFAYWQSATKTYPNNPEVWGDLCGKPIRHFKFPDCLVSKLQDQDPNIDANNVFPYNPGRRAKIYPIGFQVSRDSVKAWLRWAEDQGFITAEERLSITGYKLVRGNRVSNRSIVGKGILFDMWEYKQKDGEMYSTLSTYYPNYPFNDLRPDPYLGKAGTLYTAPNGGISNSRYSFISPETCFNGPTIGSELKIESAIFGHALGNFYEVKNHPKYILLSQAGIALAAALAAISLVADTLILIGTFLGNYTVGLAFTVPVGSIVSIVGQALNLVPQFFVYARQWRDIIYNFGVPRNFAKYYVAVGNYHSSGSEGEILNAGNKRRIIQNSSYLSAGNYTLNDSGVITKINNYQREDSVYLNLQDGISYVSTALDPSFGLDYSDTSRFILSSEQDGRSCIKSDRQSKVASFYASNKNYLPDQYGSIQDIDWLYTGECIDIDWEEVQPSTECDPVFGGDTFISRFTDRRKIPFFIDNPVGLTTSVDFQYKNISNITDSVYYFNSIGESTLNSSSIQFKEVENNFDCETTGKSMYLNGTIYLFSYGIISYIGESSYNLNYRYASDRKGGDFYPHQSDLENWTQEYRMPIETPNSYLYNRGYSKQNKENFFCTQPVNYSNADCITDYQNRLIGSLPDYDSNFNTDSWRIYLANDYKDFPLSNGRLVAISGLDRDKVMLRFENTTLVFNAYYTMTTDAGVAQIGTSDMFAQKPLEYAKSDIGYGGTQHHAFVACQYGYFWVDASRSAICYLPIDGGLQDISQSLRTFFNNNLPFSILKAFPNYPVDNPYKDIGITMAWDNKFDRLFITKLDFELKPEWVKASHPTNYVDYIDGQFVHCTVAYGQPLCTPISLTDSTYFCNKSWTIAWTPITNSWISYYSFVPNYYIAHENYFQSGINNPQDGDLTKIGLWNHLITNKSYQVFYGQLYPYITDVVVKDQIINKQLQSIEYQADFLRFQNDYDYFYNPRVTFNKMVIWSENQNSGNLELVPQTANNLSQGVLYPRANADSTSILVTRKENNWRINQFWDLVGSKDNNVPPMLLNCHPYLRSVNPDAINYKMPTFKRGRLVSDYFTLRLINDAYSNYKIINKWLQTNSITSIS